MTYLFKRHIAIPQDHGSWVFLLSPLLIGLFAGNSWKIAGIYLVIAAISVFLLRQPATILVKILSGRRSQSDLAPALFWLILYGLVGVITVISLIVQGFTFIALLAIPGIPVFFWHLYLVSRRSERRQIGVELVGSGVLALAAPAAYWVGVGSPDATGWELFALTWLQSAASIVYAYARLEQRVLPEWPALPERLKLGHRAILYTGFNFLLVTMGSIFNLLPRFLFIPYGIQLAETIWGILNPAVGVKPTRIGLRQLIISSVFTLLFIIAW